METKDRFADAVDWYLDHLRAERGASDHTISSYGKDLEDASQFFKALGVTDWAEVTGEHLQRFRASLGAPLAPSTARRKLSSLRSLFKFLQKNHQ
ncbi:MAG: site-specific integrase, partial [Armatimonadota bacterium]